MKVQTFLAYMFNGEKKILTGPSIFRATADAGVKVDEIDFFTEPENDTFVFENGKWAKKAPSDSL